MPLDKLQQAWEELGTLDPFWGITGDRTRKYGRWDVEELLSSGDAWVARVMDAPACLGYPAGREAVLDFGCGVGRLTRAFRAHFQHYYGIDIAESMIAKARELNESVSDCTFIVSAEPHLSMFADHEFDLVYSWGVLQHVPDRMVVKSYLSEFVRVLKEDGLLVFQLFHYIQPLYRLQPRRRFYSVLKKIGVPERVLYGRLGLYPQQAHFIPRKDVARFLSEAGGRILAVESESSPRSPHQSSVYYVAAS